MTAGQFKKGQTGNTKAVPRGLGQAGRLREAIAGRLDAVIEVVVEKAMQGDMAAAGLLLARAIPPLRPSDAACKVSMGRGSLTDQSRRIAAQMAAGKVPMNQGADMIATLSTIAKMKSIDELVATVDAMEKELKDIRHAITENKNR